MGDVEMKERKAPDEEVVPPSLAVRYEARYSQQQEQQQQHRDPKANPTIQCTGGDNDDDDIDGTNLEQRLSPIQDERGGSSKNIHFRSVYEEEQGDSPAAKEHDGNHKDGDDDDDGEDEADTRTCKEKAYALLKTIGPGIVVMLADTDASCIITAAESGKQWGYSLVLIQLLLIPPLYMAQELTVRIAVSHKKGLGAVVRERLGKRWGRLVVAALLVTCVGGLVSEFTSVAGAFEMFNVPTWLSAGILLITMIAVVFSGSYKRIEVLAAIMGLAECAFVVTMFLVKPNAKELTTGLITFPVKQQSYLLLFSANIGAVIMPWMIFYQCSAVAAKGLRLKQIRAEKIDTAIGALLTQLIMVAVIITCAAVSWNGKYDGSSPGYDNVGAIGESLGVVVGEVAGKALFVIGLTGGAMIGCVVVSLTGSWAATEVLQLKTNLNSRPKDAPVLYISYVLFLLVAFGVAISGVDIVLLNVCVQTMNTLLLPIVLVVLIIVATKQLPEKQRLKGVTMFVYIGLFAIVVIIGLVTGALGLISLF